MVVLVFVLVWVLKTNDFQKTISKKTWKTFSLRCWCYRFVCCHCCSNSRWEYWKFINTLLSSRHSSRSSSRRLLISWPIQYYPDERENFLNNIITKNNVGWRKNFLIHVVVSSSLSYCVVIIWNCCRWLISLRTRTLINFYGRNDGGDGTSNDCWWR